MNLVILIGNLGETPVIRKTASGKSVTTFSMATTEKWNDAQGNKQEETTWHKVQAWGNLADICGAYLTKGSRLQVTGMYKKEKPWVDNKGIERADMLVRMSEMEMLGDPKHRNNTPAQTAPQQNQQPQQNNCPYTYQQMVAAGWTDAQLLATPQYAHLVPKPAGPPTPPVASNMPPTPPTPISEAPPRGCASSQGFIPDDEYIDYGV